MNNMRKILITFLFSLPCNNKSKTLNKKEYLGLLWGNLQQKLIFALLKNKIEMIRGIKYGRKKNN